MTAQMVVERWGVPRRTVDYWATHGFVKLLFDLPGARVIDAASAAHAAGRWSRGIRN